MLHPLRFNRPIAREVLVRYDTRSLTRGIKRRRLEFDDASLAFYSVQKTRRLAVQRDRATLHVAQRFCQVRIN